MYRKSLKWTRFMALRAKRWNRWVAFAMVALLTTTLAMLWESWTYADEDSLRMTMGVSGGSEVERLTMPKAAAVVENAAAVVENAAAGEEKVCDARLIGGPLCPELFVLGVQKGGSSSVWVYLHFKYKEIQVAIFEEGWRRKEPHYFDLNIGSGLSWYLSHYPVRNSSDDLAMDGTPCYSRHWHSPERIKKQLAFEKLRFIISFRDPTARAYSAYRHVMAEFLGSRQGYVATYEAFDFSFTAMAYYMTPIITSCLETRMNAPDSVHRHCSFENHVYRSDVRTIEVHGKTSEIADLRPAAALFVDGLYGYIMLYWFRFFEPSQFCVLFFERLVANFPKEMMNAAPCLEHFGRTLSVGEDEKLPETNSKVCPACEVVSDVDKKTLKHYLDEHVYSQSNQELHTLMQTHYELDTSSVWSANG